MVASPIKICGVTRGEDAVAAEQAGAGAIGINLYSRSPRYVPISEVPRLLSAVDDISKVAVLVHPGVEELNQVLGLGFDVVQIHAPNIRALARPLVEADMPVIATAGVSGEDDLPAARRVVEEWRSAGVKVLALLIDAKVPGYFGGTGQSAAWHLLAGQDFGAPLILAGGLGPENVAAAIRQVRPHGVDVASGVELKPGIKDHQRLRAFVSAARQALAAFQSSKRSPPSRQAS
jgi:phosphoribosylanthranilate isomerase